MIVSYKNILPQKFTSKVNYNKNNLTINVGNSGTLARLIMGLLVSYPKKSS